MNIAEFDRIIDGALQDAEALERVKDVFEALGKIRRVLPLTADARLVQCARDGFLPAAGGYQRGRPGADPDSVEARARRGRLGAASRWLCAHQKRTFEEAVRLLIHFPVPSWIVDLWCWKIQVGEMQALRKARP